MADTYLKRTGNGRNDIQFNSLVLNDRYLRRTGTGRTNITWANITENGGSFNLLYRYGTSRNNIRYTTINTNITDDTVFDPLYIDYFQILVNWSRTEAYWYTASITDKFWGGIYNTNFNISYNRSGQNSQDSRRHTDVNIGFKTRNAALHYYRAIINKYGTLTFDNTGTGYRHKLTAGGENGEGLGYVTCYTSPTNWVAVGFPTTQWFSRGEHVQNLYGLLQIG